MDAHVDTFNAINGLNDGHTMFQSRCFFSMVTFLLPLPLFAVVEDGQQIVRVATRRYLSLFKGIEEDAKKLWGFDLSAYELQQVQAIEGQPAVEYIKKWADKHGGMVRNPSARFNMMFAGLDAEGAASLGQHAGEFVPRSPDSFQPEGRASLRQHPEEFVVRELVLESDNFRCPFSEGNAARNGRSGSSGSGSSSEEAPPPMLELDVLRMRPQYQQYQQPHRRQQQQPQEKQERKEEAGPSSSKVQSSDKVAPRILAGEDGAAITMEKVSADDAYYLVYLVSNRTAVIVLHTFSVDRTTQRKLAVTRPGLDPLAYLIGEIFKAMEAARRTNCTEVIFDVRDNGGGVTVMASVTAVALLGTRNVPLANATLPMDFIIGTNFTWSLVADEAIPKYAANRYSHPSDGASLLSSSQDYKPLQNVSFSTAGRAGTYTADFKSNFDKLYGALAELPGSAEPFFGARPFLFLADGDCFSTCAILTHMLGKRYKVPMVTVGGYLNQPVSVSASCLGYTMQSLNCDVSVPLSRTNHANDPHASKPFKTNMDVSMAFTNGYVDSSVPCEFEFLPSQRHVDYTVDRIDKPEKKQEEEQKKQEEEQKKEEEEQKKQEEEQKKQEEEQKKQEEEQKKEEEEQKKQEEEQKKQEDGDKKETADQLKSDEEQKTPEVKDVIDDLKQLPEEQKSSDGATGTVQSGASTGSDGESNDGAADTVQSGASTGSDGESNDGAADTVQSGASTGGDGESNDGAADTVQSGASTGSDGESNDGAADTVQSGASTGSDGESNDGAADTVQSGPSTGSNWQSNDGAAGTVQ
ncbi:unnamed protein product [Closterium sp. Naga37s-1]|nr:unnamed protein product [Closterium sp. Naga37s-1]